MLRVFRSRLAGLVGALRAALSDSTAAPEPAGPSAPLDPESAKRAVQQIIVLLQDLDLAAEECLDANREVFRSLLPADSFGPFAEEIGAFSFAFAEARARLEEAAREKGVLSP